MTRERYKVVIAGGGTGGHLYPGIAVAEEIAKAMPDVEIIFMGTVKGIEAKVLPSEKYRVKLLKTEGVVGVSLYRKSIALLKMMLAFFDAYYFLRTLKPDIVIGTGGYASFLPVFCAVLLSQPTIIHEQNSIPGMANRVLGRFVKRVCITYESSFRMFPKSKTLLTGNPVRAGILRAKKEDGLKTFSLKKDRFTVFIFGGSAGASSLNTMMMEGLSFLADLKDRIQFLHQTGTKDYEQVRAAYRRFGYSGIVTPFITNMAEAYSSSDMVVSRAGATTLAEITAIGIPSILVPYPHATASHQEENAARLSMSGAAVMIKEEDLSGQILAHKIKDFFEDKRLRDNLRKGAMVFGRPDAAKKVAAVAMSFIKSKYSPVREDYECLTTTG